MATRGSAQFGTTEEHVTFFLRNSLEMVNTNQPGTVVTSFSNTPDQGDVVLCSAVLPKHVRLSEDLPDDLQAYLDDWFADHGFAKDKVQ